MLEEHNYLNLRNQKHCILGKVCSCQIVFWHSLSDLANEARYVGPPNTRPRPFIEMPQGPHKCAAPCLSAPNFLMPAGGTRARLTISRLPGKDHLFRTLYRPPCALLCALGPHISVCQQSRAMSAPPPPNTGACYKFQPHCGNQ